MSSDAIYLVNDAGELQRVEHQFYSTEDVLQQLVAKHPELIAGDQIDPDAPPRWLLIRREATIPDSPEGPDRWWLDHLLLDQFGVPTLVEVKRSSDSRIRREVVGQMLDYVANAQAYWAAGRMRQMLVDEVGSPEAADARLVEFASLDTDPETVQEQIQRFWQKVEVNLREGNVRLLFVADELPKELRRLIEFLNGQFKNVEVLGIELRQYVGQGIKALVPRVVGRTEAAIEQKERSTAGPAPQSTNRDQFLAACSPEGASFFAKVLDESQDRGLQISWGGKSFSVRKKGFTPFFWCFLAGANGRPTDQLEVFVRDVKDPVEREKIRLRFLDLPMATSAGVYTVRIPVQQATLEAAEKALELAFDLTAQQ